MRSSAPGRSREPESPNGEFIRGHDETEATNAALSGSDNRVANEGPIALRQGEKCMPVSGGPQGILRFSGGFQPTS